MESYEIPHLNRTIHLILFKNVTNASSILNRLRSASINKTSEGDFERESVNFTFLCASMITSKLHVLSAAQQAILAEVEGNMKSKTVHGEVVWFLHPGPNIGEALKTFGMSSKSRDILLVKITKSDSTNEETAIEILKKSKKVVEVEDNDDWKGGEIELDTIERNWKKLSEIYKLDSNIVHILDGDGNGNGKGDSLDQRRIDSVACSCSSSKTALL